jgi:hypothetical protein
MTCLIAILLYSFLASKISSLKIRSAAFGSDHRLWNSLQYKEAIQHFLHTVAIAKSARGLSRILQSQRFPFLDLYNEGCAMYLTSVRYMELLEAPLESELEAMLTGPDCMSKSKILQPTYMAEIKKSLERKDGDWMTGVPRSSPLWEDAEFLWDAFVSFHPVGLLEAYEAGNIELINHYRAVIVALPVAELTQADAMVTAIRLLLVLRVIGDLELDFPRPLDATMEYLGGFVKIRLEVLHEVQAALDIGAFDDPLPLLLTIFRHFRGRASALPPMNQILGLCLNGNLGSPPSDEDQHTEMESYRVHWALSVAAVYEYLGYPTRGLSAFVQTQFGEREQSAALISKQDFALMRRMVSSPIATADGSVVLTLAHRVVARRRDLAMGLLEEVRERHKKFPLPRDASLKQLHPVRNKALRSVVQAIPLDWRLHFLRRHYGCFTRTVLACEDLNRLVMLQITHGNGIPSFYFRHLGKQREWDGRRLRIGPHSRGQLREVGGLIALSLLYGHALPVPLHPEQLGHFTGFAFDPIAFPPIEDADGISVVVEERTKLEMLLAASEAFFRWVPLGRLISEAEYLALLTPTKESIR